MPIPQERLHALLLAARQIEDQYLALANLIARATYDVRAGLIDSTKYLDKIDELTSNPLQAIGLQHGILDKEEIRYNFTHKRNERDREKKRASLDRIAKGQRIHQTFTRRDKAAPEQIEHDAATQATIESKGMEELASDVPADFFAGMGPSLHAMAKMSNDDLLYIQRDMEQLGAPKETKMEPAVVLPNGKELM